MAARDGNEGMFDPFWVLFGDEESDEEIDLRTPNRKGSNEGSGMLNYFMPEEYNLELAREERQPSESNKKDQKKKQHYWRRHKEGGRLSFGRKGTNSRNAVPSSTNSRSSFISPEQRDAGHTRETGHDDGYSVDENNELFPSMAMPSFTEAFAAPWDPWGDQSSSSGSSGASYVSDEETDDESLVSGASFGSASLETQEPPQVEQILVQFNPVVDSTTRSVASLKPVAEPTTSQTGFQPSIVSEDGSALPKSSSTDTSYRNDESAISSFEKTGYNQGFQSNIDFDVVSEERKPSSCLRLQNVCGTPGKKLERKFMLPFCRSSKVQDVDRDLATAFPKLRMIPDEKSMGLNNAAVVSNSKKFKGNVPAHLQLSSDAFLATRGPQSLYEYEYDGGEHIDVAYNHFGPNPMSLLVIRHHETTPRRRPNGAIVQIEASTISRTDCSMRNGEWMGKDTPPLPITPGVDMVGKIFSIDKNMSSYYRLSTGDRVMSLTRCGGNSRFLAIDPNQLIKIPDGVDPAEAACLAETYLSAFQVLHHGQSLGTRYRNNALKGKSILILGTVATTLGHAMVELACAAGVEKIIATSTPKHFPHLRSLGIIPVSVDPALWYDQLNGEIDLVLVSNANEEVVAEHFKVLNERGHLIVIGQRLGSGLPMSDWESQEQLSARLVCKRHKTKVSMIDRTHDYNPFRQWEVDLEKSKRDLGYLVKLLEKGEIKPNVLDRIPLSKVAKAQDMVESQRHPSGFLVCEPWLRNKKRAVKL